MLCLLLISNWMERIILESYFSHVQQKVMMFNVVEVKTKWATFQNKLTGCRQTVNTLNSSLRADTQSLSICLLLLSLYVYVFCYYLFTPMSFAIVSLRLCLLLLSLYACLLLLSPYVFDFCYCLFTYICLLLADETLSAPGTVTSTLTHFS